MNQKQTLILTQTFCSDRSRIFLNNFNTISKHWSQKYTVWNIIIGWYCTLLRHHYKVTKFCFQHTVTCIPVARQRLSKRIPTEANARNNRTIIARQRISKHTSLTIELVFSAWSVQSRYKEGFSWEESLVVRSWKSSVEEEFIWVSCC
jgi:hypothetical protein